MDLRLHNVAFWASLEQRPYEQTLQGEGWAGSLFPSPYDTHFGGGEHYFHAQIAGHERTVCLCVCTECFFLPTEKPSLFHICIAYLGLGQVYPSV